MIGSGGPTRRASQRGAIGPTQTSLMVTLSNQFVQGRGTHAFAVGVAYLRRGRVRRFSLTSRWFIALN